MVFKLWGRNVNRWNDYNIGKLTPPAIVQHDIIGKEHLIWVWTGKEIVGPLSRTEYNEEEL